MKQNILYIMAHTFNIRSKKTEGTASLSTMVRIKGKLVNINTGIMVDIYQWNNNHDAYLIEEAGEADEAHTISITTKMSRASKTIDEQIKQGVTDGKIIAKAIKNVVDIEGAEVSKKLREAERSTLLGYLDNFIISAENGIATKKNGGELRDETIRQYRVVRAALYEFLSTSEEYSTLTTFSDIDRHFSEVLISTWKKRGILPGSINRYQGCIRAICNRASEEGVNRNGSSLKIWHQIDDSENKKTEYALTEDELQAFINLPLVGLDAQCRDLFAIGCLTGQRWSDFSRINKNMLHDVNGVDMIILKQVKTGEVVYIPLADNRLVTLLQRYDYNVPHVEYHTFVKYHLRKIVKMLAEACPANLMKSAPTCLTAAEKKMEASWRELNMKLSEKKKLTVNEHHAYEYQKKFAEAHGTLKKNYKDNLYLWKHVEEGGEVSDNEVYKFQYELISSHCARRTFTTLGIKNPNLTDDDIKSVTGHKNDYNFRRYDLSGKAWKAQQLAKKISKQQETTLHIAKAE